MEVQEYAVMRAFEDDYWWYLGLQDLIFRCLRRFDPYGRCRRVLDSGCGTGKLLDLLAEFEAFGFDFSVEAVRFCHARRLSRLVRASIVAIPFADASFQAIFSMDVICCLGASDVPRCLIELGRILAPGGLLFLNLPAYQWLRSHHDLAVHTYCRFTARDLQRQLATAGFEILLCSYRTTLLFLPVVVIRLVQKLLNSQPQAPTSDLKSLPSFVNTLFTQLLFWENRYIVAGGRFLFGLSIFVVARRR
ncbi:Class I SAM-dependent methyltransferase [Desulfovibrionales bacterium]